MPSGKTHDKITILSTPIPTISTFLLSNSITLSAIVGASHLFSGLWLSPDLDTDSIMHRRWESIGLGWIWIPYRDIIPHRGISHTPLIGTLSRVPFMIPVICWSLLTQNGLLSTLLLWMLIGLESGAVFHYIPDLIFTFIKKKIKNVFGIRKRRRR